MKSASLSTLLHAFFHEWLGQQRNLSRNTVLSYRDTWRLFLRFVAERNRRPIVKLSLAELEATAVLAFLKHIEEERKASIGTRNCRLSALHAFFAVAHREPTAIAQCAEIARIPTKKGSRPAMCYLEVDEVEAILRQPDQSRPEGQRDYALLAFLYNTGARIQEALDVTPAAIRFHPPAQVRLLGKGRKERICPLWPETVNLLKALLRQRPGADNEPLFVNCYGRPLGPAGVRFKLDQYVQRAAQTMPSLGKKDISPHTFRHAAGMMLVSAGTDITVIRSFLGHERLDTTNLYARANLETKRKALEHANGSARPGKPPRWKRDPELLTWLDSM
ncbi:MAG TPA: tyrosine-type recombinase/integrase [Xanthobacteraceae bacterium]|jgi:site-specific recombinase XerD